MKLLLALFLTAAAANPSSVTWRKVESVKGFEGMRAELQRLVDSPDNKAAINHLCVVVRIPAKPDTIGPVAFVHMPEQAWIYAFNPTAYPPIDDASIWGGASIDLKRGVVPTERDIKGGLAVTRAYVDGIIAACDHHGESLVLRKRHGR